MKKEHTNVFKDIENAHGIKTKQQQKVLKKKTKLKPEQLVNIKKQD